MEIDFLLPLLGLFLLSITAGFFDTITGGGGLLTLPALLYIGLPTPVAFATNKMQAIFSEIVAMVYFSKYKVLEWNKLIIPLLIGALTSCMGAILLTYIEIKYFVPIILSLLLIYYILPQKQQGKLNTPNNFQAFYWLGPSIGFYTGFFGPGTSSVWNILLVKILHLDLRHAVMYGKPFNFFANAGALLFFLYYDLVNLPIAFLMGIGGWIGGKVGAKIMIRSSLPAIKIMFITLLSILIIVLFYRYYI